MGSYELIENILHYTGDGLATIELTDLEIKSFKQKKINGFDLFNDGRQVF